MRHLGKYSTATLPLDWYFGESMMKFCRTTLAIACLIVLPMQSAFITTGAEARPNTRSYSCSALRQLIARRGAVVMNYKGNSVYKKFVRDVRFCRFPHNTVRRFSVASKSGRCSLLICYEWEPFFRDRFW